MSRPLFFCRSTAEFGAVVTQLHGVQQGAAESYTLVGLKEVDQTFLIIKIIPSQDIPSMTG